MANKKIEIKELIYILKTNLLIELIILIAVVGLGFGYTKINDDYYVAQSNVMIKADVVDGSEYNNTVLSKMYLKTIASLFTKDAIVDRANEICGGGIKASSITVLYEEDNLLLDVYYKDFDKQSAKEKLEAIIFACEEFSANSGALPANIKVVNVAYETKVKNESDDKKIITLSFILAIILVGAYVVFLYFVKDKVSSVDRVESITGKKNIAVVEKKKTSEVVKLELGDQNQIAYINADLRKLSDMLIYMSDGNNKVYQIQSSIPCEGKTTVSTNLAKALGLSQRKTLVIDCDFAKPSVHKIFNVEKSNGITEYFKGESSFENIVKPTKFDNVDLITCGESILNHPIFLTSSKFESIIEKAKENYDFIILDCAPVSNFSDYINISAISDATILVVGNNLPSARELDYTVKELEECKANVIGTVFNFSAVETKRRYNY